MTETVRSLFQEAQPGPQVEDLGPTYLETARTIARILSTRLLLLIAVVVGSVVWAYTVYAPATDRLYAAIAFSVVFVLPLTVLYLKRG